MVKWMVVAVLVGGVYFFRQIYAEKQLETKLTHISGEVVGIQVKSLTIKHSILGDVWVDHRPGELIKKGMYIRVIGRLNRGLIYENRQGFVLKPERIWILQRETSWLQSWILWRQRLMDKLLAWIPGEEGGLAAGIMWGGSESLHKTTKDDFKISGMTHILAASGYNVAVVAKWFSGIFSRLVNGKKRFMGMVAVIWIYVGLAGMTVSVVRAGVMATLVAAAKNWGRQVDMGWLLALAGAMMLIWEPANLVSVSFQLSVAAMAGLIWIDRLICIPKYVSKSAGEVLRATLATQVTTLPILWRSFGEVSWVAPLVNLGVLWIVPIVMQILMISMMVGLVWNEAGWVISFGAWPFLRLIIGLSEWTGAHVDMVKLKPIGWVEVGLYYAVLAGIYYKLKRRVNGTENTSNN